MEYNYSDLGLKTNTESIVFKFGDKEIEIFKYLPLEYKYDVIMSALHDSDEQGVYNYLKLDAYFNLNMFLSYVKNVNFTQEQMNDKLKLYNEIYSSGLLEAFLAAIDEKEYNDCYDVLERMVEVIMKYRNTAGAVLQTVINAMPEKAKEAAAIVDGLDSEKMGKISGLADTFKDLVGAVATK